MTIQAYRRPPKRGRLFLPAAWTAMALGVWYLHWRLGTLNREDPLALALSLALFGAEVYGFLSFALFFFQCAGTPPYRRSSLPSRLPTVDVFVTVYNEPVDVLYRTLVCCQAMEYPRDRMKVYVLDDGGREEVRKVARELGCFYIHRAERRDAKAGNINHALEQTQGELVAIFDCDHIPVRSFLLETVGYFQDPRVAIVQTPHYFYNPDTFQKNLRLERYLSNEQDLFFQVIQPGRDRHNAAFFAGSSGLFRRRALAAIGGIQTLTVTEDLHTSMVLHARGWRSVYVPRILAAGLAPESFEAYLRQRRRWTRGGVQVFLLDNPLLKRGLTLLQRLHYFASTFYFFHGFARLAYLAAPLAFLLLGYAPIVARWEDLLLHFLPYYLASLWTFHQVGGATRNPFWSDVYETAMCFAISATALGTLLRPWNTPFQVTPKGIHREAHAYYWHLVWPHLLLLILLVAGGFWGVHRYLSGTLAAGDALLISLVWGAYNILLLGAVLSVARERRQARRYPRLPRMLPAEILTGTGRIPCLTQDLSETGASLLLDRPVGLPMVVALQIQDGEEVLTLRALVTRNDQSPSGGYSVGVHFLHVDARARQAIIRFLFSHPLTWERPPQGLAGPGTSFRLLLEAPVRAFLEERVLRRVAPRVARRLPCQVVLNGRPYPASTEDVSLYGARVRLNP